MNGRGDWNREGAFGMNRRGFAFILEAGIALLAAIAVLSFASSPPIAQDYRHLRARMLLSDVLLSAQDANMLASVEGLASANPLAKGEMERTLESIAQKTGDYCIRIEAEGNAAQSACGGEGRNSQEASALVFDGGRFIAIRGRISYG